MNQSTSEIIRPLTIVHLLRFKGSRKASLALKIVRVLVGLEYGLVVAAYVTVLLQGQFPEGWLYIPFAIIGGIIYYCLCGFGIMVMGWVLEKVSNEAPLELWAFIAIGLAPISAILYMAVALYLVDNFRFAEWLNSWLLLLLVPVVGFYSPFILPTYWLRYRYREDEF